MTTSIERFCVAVIMQKTALANPWASERWEPVAVELTSADLPRAIRAVENAPHPQWRFDGETIELHRSEAEGYYLNLAAPEPKVFVMWRMLEPEAMVPGGPAAAPFVVTVSYNQAARMLDGGEQVDAVPLPAEIRRGLEPFVQAHYKPEPRKKFRRRDPLVEDAGAVPEPNTSKAS